HAGDGNLHPLLLFDGRQPGVLERVHAAGAEIITASLDAGGVLSGEHGIGVEKQAYMSRQFSDDDLDHQERLRKAFDPTCRTNPGKVLPIGHSCADIQALRSVPTGVWGWAPRSSIAIPCCWPSPTRSAPTARSPCAAGVRGGTSAVRRPTVRGSC